MSSIVLDTTLGWREVVAIAEGAGLGLSAAAGGRIDAARAVVDAIVARGIRAYGVNTGVGALCEVVVDRPLQRRLSRNLLMSHATGIGVPLGRIETRAIIAAAINNYAHGHSGIRREVVQGLAVLLERDCIPVVPARGSVGYLSHMAHIGLVLIGAGKAAWNGEVLDGGAALDRIGQAPLVLEAKEGLSLVNGTPCATGLACLVLARGENLLAWSDAIAAMSFENLRGNPAAFDPASLALRRSPGLQAVGRSLRRLLDGSAIIAVGTGRGTGAGDGAPAGRTQEALSLRAIPHVHGAARDVLAEAAAVVDRELASVTDNPLVTGTPDQPEVHSQAHAVGAALALAMDSLAIALAGVAAMSERRFDRLINPLVSGLPPFLAADSGVASGFMIAQYAAVSLVAENRRLALPASLDGGVTSALQEDHLAHATPAALKALALIENAERILALEYLAAAQAYEFQRESRAPGTDRFYCLLRSVLPAYADDRPLSDDMEQAWRLIRTAAMPV
ncbi:MAG TPA: histidine ammonia-lyase [Stellaceae bacterium]|nr:histidine ammonia-lyase [Stellaceae bacterium]